MEIERKTPSKAAKITAISGLVIAVLSLVVSWIPCFYIISAVLGPLGLILSLVGFNLGRKAQISTKIAKIGLIGSALSIIVAAVIHIFVMPGVIDDTVTPLTKHILGSFASFAAQQEDSTQMLDTNQTHISLDSTRFHK